MAVRTTRIVSRGLERERNAESNRRGEWAGCAAATSVRMVDAFAGRVPSPADGEDEAASIAVADDDDDDGGEDDDEEEEAEEVACLRA